MSNLNRYALFFSNYCNFSKEVISIITRKNIRNAFVFICIDTYTTRPLPDFVDRVPLVTCLSTKQVFYEDSINTVLESISNAMYPPQHVEAAPVLHSIQESEYEAFGQDTSSYSMLDMNNFRINTVADDEDGVKGRKLDSSQLEQLIASRDTDVSLLSDKMTFR